MAADRVTCEDSESLLQENQTLRRDNSELQFKLNDLINRNEEQQEHLVMQE